MKRALDVILSVIGLIVLLPVLITLAFIVRWRIGRPVFFTQQRPGLHGRPFRLIKFRTMTNARLPDGRLRPDAERLVPLGAWLRRTSLDELPELWNVLKGDMSIVGPRPLLMEYLSLYDARQATRHDVRPGLTGWAQVNGRNALSWPEKLELDAWYVEHRSLALDLEILWRTLGSVLSRKGISQDGHATAEPFRGNAP